MYTPNYTAAQREEIRKWAGEDSLLTKSAFMDWRGVLYDLLEDLDAKEEAPRLTLDEVFAECKKELWILRQQKPDTNCPAKPYLPLLYKALALLEEAQTSAQEFVPLSLRHAGQQYTRRFGPDWIALAEKHPELRHLWIVTSGVNFLAMLIEDLENENRPPVPAQTLKLSKVREEPK